MSGIQGLLWHDLNRDGLSDAGEPGLPQISLHLFQTGEHFTATAITDAAGRYSFGNLCAGNYLIVVDEATVPPGVLPPDTGDAVDIDSGDDPDDGADDESDDRLPEEDLGGWAVQLDDDNAKPVILDLGFVGCELGLTASCSMASLASELYRCEKPIDVLSMVWNGQQAVRVIAHKGKRDDEVLLDRDQVAPGDRVTVNGIAGAPDDVTWEIFAAGTEVKLGESRFRVDCDDEEMDGPEDCGLAQGNGRDNKDQYLNHWLLEGIVDDSGLLECTRQTATNGGCEFQGISADCDLIDKVNWLTLVYTGGGCAASDNRQPEKFECDGAIDGALPVTVIAENGETLLVQPGAPFTIARDGNDTEIELHNAMGAEFLKIHTSCSEPLTAGDVFGSLTLAAINGVGIGTHVDYEYRISNAHPAAVVAHAREAPTRTLLSPAVAVAAQSSKTVTGTAWIMNTTTSAVVLEDRHLELCSGADYVTAAVAPAWPCEISGSGIRAHDKEIRWELANTDKSGATIERIEVHWPGQHADKLKEIKLDGEKIFDQDRYGEQTEVSNADLIGEFAKRHLVRGDEKELKIIFDDEIDNLSLDDFGITVYFEQNCVVTW